MSAFYPHESRSFKTLPIAAATLALIVGCSPVSQSELATQSVTLKPVTISALPIPQHSLELSLEVPLDPASVAMRLELENLMVTGISRHQAVRLALLNSPRLKRAFESIDISYETFHGLHFFESPRLETLFKTCSECQPESSDTASLEDSLWNPELCVTADCKRYRESSLKVVQVLLDIVATTRRAYDDTLCARARLNNGRDILTTLKNIRSNSQRPHDYQKNARKSRNVIESMEQDWQLDRERLEARSDWTARYLARVLGVNISQEQIVLSERLALPSYTITDASTLLDQALVARPDLLVVRDGVEDLTDEPYSLSLREQRLRENITMGVKHLYAFENQLKVYREGLLPDRERAVAKAAQAYAHMRIDMVTLLAKWQLLYEGRNKSIDALGVALDALTDIQRGLGEAIEEEA